MTSLIILLQSFFSPLGTLFPKSFKGPFSSNSRIDVMKFKQNLCERYRDILERSFPWSEIGKNWTILMCGS